MTRQLSYWHLIGRLLELDDLLVDKLRLLVHDEIGVKRALFRRITRGPVPSALPWEGHAAESSENSDVLCVVAGPALDMDFCRLGRHD